MAASLVGTRIACAGQLQGKEGTIVHVGSSSGGGLFGGPDGLRLVVMLDDGTLHETVCIGRVLDPAPLKG